MIAREHGTSLIELMIALTLSSILIATLGSLLVNTRAVQHSADALIHVTENTSHALWFLVRELRRAGFYGPPAGAVLTGASTAVCDASSPFSESITLFPVMTSPAFPRYCWRTAAMHSSALFLTYAEPPSQVHTVSNTHAAIVAQANGALRWVLPIPPHTVPIAGAAHLHALYVDATTESDIPACTPYIPALFRETREQSGSEPREEIARGIERIATHFGVDTDGDGAVDAYRPATQVSDWRHVYAVKLWLLGRSECPTSTHAKEIIFQMGDERIVMRDRFQRVLLTTTVALRGRLGMWDGA